MHQFDPNENPYVDDLLRLLDTLRGPFSRAQIRALARVYVSRLYGVDTGGFFEYARRQMGGLVRCSVRVVLDGDDLLLSQILQTTRGEQLQGRLPYEARLVLVRVGYGGVIELFNGRRSVFEDSLRELGFDIDPRRRDVIHAHDLFRVMARLGDEEGRVLPLDGTTYWDAHWLGDAGDDAGAWEHREYDPPPADTDNGRGRYGGSDGGGRGGDGEGPQGPDDRGGPGSGRGGVMEVLDHPVLFSADPQLLADILEDL